ncbi:hypothetical protein [Rhabdothermincola sp.]|uniref:hypothetical protein n=1 Tax=Rhabdothermincola sp. TaxID=2820405 RepID=UPI002FE186AB
MRRHTRSLGAVVGVAVLGSGLVVVAPMAYAEPLPQTVSIRVELDLPSCCDGPRVFEVTDAPVGPGPELTAANEVANPSNYCGALNVDVDNVAQTVTITPDTSQSCSNFETATVTVEGEGINTLTLVSDNLWLDQPETCEMNLLPFGTQDGAVTINWASTPVGSEEACSPEMNFEGGAAVFSYQQSAPTTSTTTTSTTIATTEAPTTTAPAAAAVARPRFTG